MWKSRRKLIEVKLWNLIKEDWIEQMWSENKSLCSAECATTALTIEKVSRCRPEGEKFDAIDFAQHVCFQGNLLWWLVGLLGEFNILFKCYGLLWYVHGIWNLVKTKLLRRKSVVWSVYIFDVNRKCSFFSNALHYLVYR